MKKIFKFLLFIVFIFLVYFIYINYIQKSVTKLQQEKEKAVVEDYYIYGNHFNIKGTLDIDNDNYESIKLVLYNGEEIEKDVIAQKDDNGITFYISEYINDGLYLDNIARGFYYLFLKLTYKDEKDNLSKYYVLKNDTDYKDTVYYSLSKYNNKITIETDDYYETISFNIEDNKDDNIYDITIDPGHGGRDSGAIYKDYMEKDFTMNISKKIKKNLEEKGLKVKLTHDKDELSSNDLLSKYNAHGRAVIPNEVKSKYTFSIHTNKNEYSKVNGVEVYTASNIEYSFAKKIAKAITDNTNLEYSNNKNYKVYDGVYTHNFSNSEVLSTIKEFESGGIKPYNVTVNANYLFMIRETGGYMTGAYMDNRNNDVNPYYNSNVGNESYLIETAYLSNSNDLDVLINNQNKIAKAISDTIIDQLLK